MLVKSKQIRLAGGIRGGPTSGLGCYRAAGASRHGTECAVLNVCSAGGCEGRHDTSDHVSNGCLVTKKEQELKQRKKVEKLENKQFKTEVNFQYQKFLEENLEI